MSRRYVWGTGAVRKEFYGHAILASLFDFAHARGSALQVFYYTKDTERSEAESELKRPETNFRNQPRIPETV